MGDGGVRARSERVRYVGCGGMRGDEGVRAKE